MDKTSISLLKVYLERTTLTLHQLAAILNQDYLSLAEPINYLRKKGFLRVEQNYATMNTYTADGLISPDTPLEITVEGKIALEGKQKLSKTKRIESIRHWITTAIAVAAFIKSFFF